MPNIRNMTYNGHNWIRTIQIPNTRTMSFRMVSLFTDEEYKEYKKDLEKNPNNKPKFRRLKETDRELVEFKFGKEVPEGEKSSPMVV
jgi:hypothetical protein